MKVDFNINIPKNNYNLSGLTAGDNLRSAKGYCYENITQKPDSFVSSNISFGSLHGIKPEGKINIEIKKNKLTEQLENILKADITDGENANRIEDSIKEIVKAGIARIKSIQIAQLYEFIKNDKSMNRRQRLYKLHILEKKQKEVEKTKQNPRQNPQVKQQNEEMDYPLINKFKSAILNYDFNLAKVFKKHYSELNEITTIEELQKRYPLIKVPERPENVAAKKIADTLTRDFYETLDDLYSRDEIEQAEVFIDSKIGVIIADMAKKYKLDEKMLYQKLAVPAHRIILSKYENLITNSGISSCPQARKIKTPVLTDNDTNLLSVDYDDFVLFVLSRQYLKFDKLSEITYSKPDSDIKIFVSRLKEPGYKFEKLSEKVKKFISAARIIQNAQRDYESFDTESLKSSLWSFLNYDAADNSKLLSIMSNFETCAFVKEDKEQLIKLLRLLDDIKDENKTCKSVLDIIQEEGIGPSGTDRLNEAEWQKTEAEKKLEQKKRSQLAYYNNRFNAEINKLYKYRMNYLAGICENYRPKNLDSESLQNADFIIKLISDNCTTIDGEQYINISKIENTILRWNKYNEYKTRPEDSVFQRAVEFSKQPDGSIDIDLAGHYIINAELVKNYPESLKYAKNPDMLSLIMDNTSNVPYRSAEYLCKFDDYQDLAPADKTYISKYVDMFNLKDSVEKLMLKYIVENEYIKVDTSKFAKAREEAGELVPVTIGAEAKQCIVSKYKFPTCLEYLEGFEKALSSFAVAKKSSGIKKISRNNKNSEYYAEIKITGHNNRLMCRSNDYYFDVFSETGTH